LAYFGLRAMQVRSALMKISSTEESAGALLMSHQTPEIRVFKTISFRKGDSSYPTARELEFVQAMNDAWNSGATGTAFEEKIKTLIPAFAGMTGQSGINNELLTSLMSAEAFSTETGVVVLDKTYRDLNGPFIPFHTHLGYPTSFEGLARFAPTAADVEAHRLLMSKQEKAVIPECLYRGSMDPRLRHAGMTTPGLILHASGEFTLFWPGADENDPVKLAVIENGRVKESSATEDQLRMAEKTGCLTLLQGSGKTGTFSVPGIHFNMDYDRVVLWDERKTSCPTRHSRMSLSGIHYALIYMDPRLRHAGMTDNYFAFDKYRYPRRSTVSMRLS
jgi:hypothetical protein